MPRVAVVLVVLTILIGGGTTLIMPFTDTAKTMREAAKDSRLTSDQVHALGGGSRGSMWNNIGGHIKQNRAPPASDRV